VATGSGPSLGAAILALVAAPVRSTKQMIAYILSPRTGASVPSVSRQLGIKQSTVRGWAAGKTAPSAESQRRIKDLYHRFFKINNKTTPLRDVSTAKLIIRNDSDPRGIEIQGRTVNPINVERSMRRKWTGVLAAATPAEAEAAFFAGVLGPSPLPPVGPDYLDFGPGGYTITTS
jgi:hypothetical protein